MLKDMPGVTVDYYDVSGKSLDEVRQAIAAQRQQGASGQAVAAGTNWTVDADVKKRTVGDKCEIVAGNVKFSGKAELPRLVTPQLLQPQEIQIWNDYVAGLEATAAEDLAFVQERMGEVEKALVSSSCDTAGAAANAAIDRLKAQQRLHIEQRTAAKAAAAQEQERQRNAARSGEPDTQ
jgi:predicted secreted Zn-dependent protease